MEDSFIVEILLKAIDQASGPIRNVNKAVDDLKAKANAESGANILQKDLDGLGDSARKAEQDLRAQRQEAERAESVHQRAARATDQHTQATGKQSEGLKRAQGNVGEHSAAIDKNAESQKKAAVAAENLRAYQQKLDDEYTSGKTSVDEYADGLRRLAQQYDKLSNSQPFGSADNDYYHKQAENARSAGKASQEFEAQRAKALQDAQTAEERAAAERTASQQRQAQQEAAQAQARTDRKAREAARADANAAKAAERDARETAQLEQMYAREAEAAEKASDRKAAAAEKSDARVKASAQKVAESERNLRQQAADIDAEHERLSMNMSSGYDPESATALQNLARRAQTLQNKLPVGSDEQRQMTSVQSRAVQLARAPVSEGPDPSVARESQLSERVANLSHEYDGLKASIDHLPLDEQRRAFQQVSQEASGLTRNLARGSDEWREMHRVAEDANNEMKKIGSIGAIFGNLKSAASGGGLQDVDKALDHLGESVDKVGVKWVSMSAELRGAVLGFAIGAIQQLDTAIVGTVGTLFSLASAAVQAGATLGGAFVAGLGEAVPATLVFGDALSRLKVIMSAVSAAQSLQQTSASQGLTSSIDALSQTNSTISAEQNLANAYIQVKDAQTELAESQQNLTQARLDAQRQIQDLMFAEEQAELQEKGANISLVEAQQNLQATIAQGGTGTQLSSAQLQVQQAQLAAREAPVTTSRARYDSNLAQRRGVNRNPQVEAATMAVTQGEQGLQSAIQGVGAASRALKIADLQTKEGNTTIADSANKLKYYLDQLSPAERKIYEAMDRIANYFQSPTSPFNKIGDALLTPISGALDKVYGLLNNPKFLAPFDKLAKAMGSGLNSIFKTMDGKQGQNFLDEMANDATRDAPLLTTFITNLMKMFEQLARAAVPALTAILHGLDDVTGRLAKKWETPQGLANLTKFFNDGVGYIRDFAHWIGALSDLLMALGHSAAPVGGGLLSGWTDGLNKMTDWVDANQGKVRSFFQEAGVAFNGLLKIVGAFGLGMIHLMNAGSLTAFAQLFSTLIVPTLVDASRLLGTLTHLLTDLLNAVPGLKTFVEIFGGIGIAAIVVGKALGPIRAIVTMLGALKDGGAAFASLGGDASMLERLKAARDAVATRLDTEKGITSEISAQNALLTDQLGIQEGIAAATDTEAADEAVVDTGAAGAGAAGAASAVEGDGAAVAEGDGAAVAEGGGLSGVLGAGGSLLQTGGMLAGIYALYKGFTDKPDAGSTSTGLGSVLGPIGGKHYSQNLGDQINQINPFSSSFSPIKGFLEGNTPQVDNQSRGTDAALKKLQENLKGVSNPAELSTSKVHDLYEEAYKVSQLPDITDKQRAGFEKLLPMLDPVKVQLEKIADASKAMEAEWSSSFGSISAISGNVLSQVKQQVSTNIANISSNLGTGTQQGTEALIGTMSGAYQSIVDNTSKAVRNTQQGIQAIGEMFEKALKALGINGVPVADAKKTFQAVGSLSHVGITGSLAASLAPTLGGQYATGGVPTLNRPTGNVINQPTYITGEEAPTHKEYVIATNPAYRERNQGLLQQAGRDIGMPGFAQGGVLSYGDIEGYWEKAGGPKSVASIAAAITGAEASFQPRIIQQGQPYSTTGWGLWQITPGDSEPQFGVDQALLNPYNNAEAAVAKFKGAGNTFAPWTTYMDGAYKAFLHGDVSAAAANALSGAGSNIDSVLKSPKIKDAVGAAGSLGQSVLNMTTAAANRVLNSLLGTSGSSGSGSSRSSGAASSGGASSSGSTLDIPSGSVQVPHDSWNAAGKPIATWIIPVLRWAASHGWSGSIDSGYRSYSDQEYLYTHAGTDGISSIVAKPGTSNHEKSVYPGGAVDVDGGSDSQLISVLRGYKNAETLVGGYLGPADPYHFSADGRRTGGVIYAANGYEGYTEQPTTFVTSEHGQAEHVHITPGYKTGAHATGTDSNTNKVPTPTAAAQTALNSLSSLLPTNEITPSTLASITNILSYISQATTIVTKIADSAKGSTALLTSLVAKLNVSDTGAFDQLAAAFTVIQNAMNTALVLGAKAASFAGPSSPLASLQGLNAAYSTGSGNPYVNIGDLASGNTIGATRNRAGYVTERLSPVRQDNEATAALVRQQRLLGDQRTALETELNPVAKQLEKVTREDNGGKNSKYNSALSALRASYTALVNRLQTVTGSLATGVTNIFNSETQTVNDRLAALSDSYGTQQTLIQNRQATAQQKGNYGLGKNGAGTYDADLVKSATSEISKLQPVLQAAKASGDKDLVSQVTQQISELQQTAAQAAISALTDAQAAIDNAAQTKQSGIQAAQGAAQAFGNYNVSATLDKQLADAASAQITALDKQLAKAKKSGNTAAAQSIQQQINQLQGTVATSTAQIITDQVTAITNSYQTSQSGIQSQQSSASSMGNFNLSAQLDQMMADSATSEIQSLQGELAAAQKSGNTGAAQQIIQQINQLESTVTQMVAQKISDQMSAIQATAQTQQAQVSSLQTIAGVQESAATTPAGFAQAGQTSAAAEQLNQSSLQSQLSQYNTLLGQASAAGDTGAVNSITQTIDQLTGELAQNTQAIQDNTANVISETASYIQARGQFSSGVYGGIAQILQTVGQTTGVTDVAGEAEAYGRSNTTLQGTNAGLVGSLSGLGGGAGDLAAALKGLTDPSAIAAVLSNANIAGIESTMDAPTQQVFEGIISSLETNTESIATNNQQLATLNGQLLQPQSWSSMTWSAYRQAVFNGMGGLLPSYASVLPAGSAPTTVADNYVNSSVGSSGTAPLIGTLNMTSPTETLDPQVMGEQLNHQIATTPT
jgi:hypothetical protein